MKKFITIIAFLLVSIPVSAQNYFSVTYINVSPENVSEVARLESTYWSKVAQANIDSGKLLAWGLFARAIPAGNDTWTHAYINVYDSLEKMLDFGQWNPQEILGINNQDIATGDLVNNYVVHHYKVQASINGDSQFSVWNFARPENLQGFVMDNINLWKPFFEKDMGGRTSWGIGTKITNVTSDNATVMTWDGYGSLLDAVNALDYPLDASSYEGPKGDKTSEYNPNGWGAQVIVQRALWLSSSQ